MTLDNNYAIRDRWLLVVHAAGLESVCSSQP